MQTACTVVENLLDNSSAETDFELSTPPASTTQGTHHEDSESATSQFDNPRTWSFGFLPLVTSPRGTIHSSENARPESKHRRRRRSYSHAAAFACVPLVPRIRFESSLELPQGEGSDAVALRSENVFVGEVNVSASCLDVHVTISEEE